jgi:hypothetical protein
MQGKSAIYAEIILLLKNATVGCTRVAFAVIVFADTLCYNAGVATRNTF